MTQSLDPVFTAALRRELVALPHRRRPSRRRSLAIATAVVGALAGSTLSAVAGLLPPEQVADLPLAPPVIVNGVGSGWVPLPPAPDGATYVNVELACFEGTRCFSYPGNGVSGSGPRDPNSQPNPVERVAVPLSSRPDPDNPQQLPALDPARGVPVNVEPGAHWRLYAAYSTSHAPKQARLQDGRLAGVGLEPPDLLSAVTTDGKPGWISYPALLDAAHPRLTADSAQQEPLPVYAGDGTTVIGVADVSRPAS